jgi:diguanylate cyclase (GGDEF)-like protein/PAS domain S-box-containing protein
MPDRLPPEVTPAQPPHSALGLGRVARQSGWAVAGDGKGDLELVADWYRQLVDHSPDGICVYRDGLVQYVNPAGARLMRAGTTNELVGRPITDFVTTDSLEPMLADIAALRHLGEYSPSFPARMIRCDGSLLDVEVVAVLTVWERQVALEIITRDVSERNAREAAMRYQAALVNHVSDAIIGTTTDGVVTSWNPAAEAIYGRAADDAVGRPVSELVGADVDPAAVVACGGIVHAIHRAAAGHPLEVRLSAAAMDHGFVLVCCDLTALRRAEQHFEAVVTVMVEAIIVLDKDGVIKSLNPAAVRIMGAGPEYVGVNFFELTNRFPYYDAEGIDIPLEVRPALTVLRTGKPRFNEVFGIDGADGKRRWLMSSCRMMNPGMPESDMLISFLDITAERETADRVMFYALHDTLTDLPNRATILRKLKRALQPNTVEQLRAVLFIDIDDLKTTNDTLGHMAGDDVLRAAAQRLLRATGADGVVGRLGGDEFVVLVFGDASAGDITDLVERVRQELTAGQPTDATTLPVCASIGVVDVAPGDPRSADEILRDADSAMYDAKRARS